MQKDKTIRTVETLGALQHQDALSFAARLLRQRHRRHVPLGRAGLCIVQG